MDFSDIEAAQTEIDNLQKSTFQNLRMQLNKIQFPMINPPECTNLQELAMSFETKDSGNKREFKSGMVRNASKEKLGWHRVSEGPMLKRWAELLSRGATVYPDIKQGQANWTLAAGVEEYEQFRESAYRHFMEWFYGENPTEDGAAAVFFNINGAEYVKEKLQTKPMDIRQG